MQQIMRVIGWSVFGIVCFVVIGFTGHLLEPRTNLDLQSLDVIKTDYITTDSGTRMVEALAVLPNGSQHIFRTFLYMVSADNRMCGVITLGNWSGTYRTELVAPSSC